MQNSRVDLLFDDFSLLIGAIGRDRLMPKSVNANCDCGSYYPTEDETITDPDKSPKPVSQEN